MEARSPLKNSRRRDSMATVDLEKRRLAGLRSYAISQAMGQFEAERPQFRPEEIVVLFAAYEEEGNIGMVLDKMPTAISGRPFSTVVVVDGGTDKTADICRNYPEVAVIEFPTNLGH